MRFAAAALLLAALGLACGGRNVSVEKPDSAASGGAANGGSGGGLMLGGTPNLTRCGTQDCPAQAGLSVCCASENSCGYVGTVSGPCVPSVSGNRALTVVDYPNGGLCPAAPCASSASCPRATPALGSGCAGTGPCSYCYPGDLSRSYECEAGVWQDLGASDCYSEVITP